jgi:glycoprotein endo-alpha-1,2-mannosidase
MRRILNFRQVLIKVLFVTCLTGIWQINECQAEDNISSEEFGNAEKQVLAFYYPWYGLPEGRGGAGRMVHWGRVDDIRKDISGSTNYPSLGAYDSHEPELIGQHCRWAKEAGIDGFIVSWWGHGNYEDRAMLTILDVCGGFGLSVCIYYEQTVGDTAATAKDIVKVLNRYGGHSAYLKVKSKPVVFVYVRALNELGLIGWHKTLGLINEQYEKRVTAIGDQLSYGSARVFDGIHTYNTAGMLSGKDAAGVDEWARDNFAGWVDLAEGAGAISTLTLIPGYDDTKIREPGLKVERLGGRVYEAQWENALAANPRWVLITSFNEWHEGSEIEPSLEDGDRYLELTKKFTARFKAQKFSKRKHKTDKVISDEEKELLGNKLKGVKIAVLPDGGSMAFWWLLDMNIDMDVLTWEDIVADSLTAKKYKLALYCGAETYQSTVRQTNDVNKALKKYLQSGGTLAVLPAGPMPFYYDRSSLGQNRAHEFGLNLNIAWERPPDSNLRFVQPKNNLTHIPKDFSFPAAGDRRWRPSYASDAHKKYTPLLQLYSENDEYLGDAIAYAQLKTGGTLIYCWFELLNGPYAEKILYDIFDFMTAESKK